MRGLVDCRRVAPVEEKIPEVASGKKKRERKTDDNNYQRHSTNTNNVGIIHYIIEAEKNFLRCSLVVRSPPQHYVQFINFTIIAAMFLKARPSYAQLLWQLIDFSTGQGGEG
jgi:hypothetical protein